MTDDVRDRILALLGTGPATIDRLSSSLGLPGGVVSYQLKLLEQAGLVRVGGTRRVRGVLERTYVSTAAAAAPPLPVPEPLPALIPGAAGFPVSLWTAGPAGLARARGAADAAATPSDADPAADAAPASGLAGAGPTGTGDAGTGRTGTGDAGTGDEGAGPTGAGPTGTGLTGTGDAAGAVPAPGPQAGPWTPPSAPVGSWTPPAVPGGSWTPPSAAAPAGSWTPPSAAAPPGSPAPPARPAVNPAVRSPRLLDVRRIAVDDATFYEFAERLAGLVRDFAARGTPGAPAAELAVALYRPADDAGFGS